MISPESVMDRTGTPLTLAPFADGDLAEAGAIACRLWAGEIPDLPDDLAPRLYDYLVRYYYHKESAFNLAARDADGKLVGFLLASPPVRSVGTGAEEWLSCRLQSEAERDFHRNYFRYLEYNRLAELRDARSDGELLLLLFCSIRKGVGRFLLAEEERLCRAEGISSWLLWTDETCDFDYYYRNGFAEARRFPGAELAGRRFQTYLFRREL